MSPAWQVAKRSVLSFYDDQGTHHAAALLNDAVLLALLFGTEVNAAIEDTKRISTPAGTQETIRMAARR